MALRDSMAKIEQRLAKMELAAAKRFDQDEQRMDELESRDEAIRGEMQSTILSIQGEMEEKINSMSDMFETQLAQVGVSLREAMVELKIAKAELKVTKADILCKVAVAQGGVARQSGIEVPRPIFFNGSRNARELENFLWGLERYFDACGMTDNATKLKTVPLYLADTAMVWWRRRLSDIERGTCVMESWDDFRREIKRQFYPDNVEHEARAKIRRLAHEGTIREYVKEFTELILEISDMSEKDTLFAFIDGLQPWARTELQRRGVQDLASAIATAESLVEQRTPTEGLTEGPRKRYSEGTWRSNKVNGGGEQPVQPYDDESKVVSCFFCAGPHIARDCPGRRKLAAVMQEKPGSSQANVGSMRMLSSAKAFYQ